MIDGRHYPRNKLAGVNEPNSLLITVTREVLQPSANLLTASDLSWLEVSGIQFQATSMYAPLPHVTSCGRLSIWKISGSKGPTSERKTRWPICLSPKLERFSYAYTLIRNVSTMDDRSIDYRGLTEWILAREGRLEVPLLSEWLEDEWLHHYKQMTPRTTNICGQSFNSFEYVYDDVVSLEKAGKIATGGNVESRVVYVHGSSATPPVHRDVTRQRGWVGPTGRFFGPDTDKGHFMAHSIGGGLEINIFAQCRHINRGWSERGKLYRRMEKYCADNLGVYCFSRPIYGDLSSRPSSLEFGILTSDGKLWVERFENE